MTGLELVLAVGATARVTRLVTTDQITAPLRSQVIRRVARKSERAGAWLESLLSCDWCAGFWVAGFVVAAWWVLPATMWVVAATVFTLSQAAGMIASMEADDE